MIKINGVWPLELPKSSEEEWLGNMEYHHNTWEMLRLRKLEEWIKDGTIVMYIGAYKGDMAALLQTWGAKLIVMESTPAFWTLIEETWKLNDLEKPVGFWSGLVSNKSTGEMPVETWPTRKAPYIEGKVGFTHLAESKDDPTFPQITVDDYVKFTGLVPDIITMDVEGSELEILKGSLETIDKYKPKFMLSVHPEFMFHNHGTYERELHDLLRNRGYTGTWLDYDHEHHWAYVCES